MTNWSRPASVNFPSVWATLEGKKIVNGAKRTYWIQDLTDDYKDEVLHHMQTDFLREEPLTKYAKIADVPEFFQAITSAWEKMLEEKLSLICLTKDENGVTHLAGCNVLGIKTKDDEIKESTSNLLGIIYYVYGIKDIFSEVNTGTILDEIGLYVLPEYRGEEIGTKLLKARRGLSLAMGLKATVTLFTSVGGKKCAEMADFKDIVEIYYENLEKINPFFKLPGLENDPSKSMRLMYNIYE